MSINTPMRIKCSVRRPIWRHHRLKDTKIHVMILFSTGNLHIQIRNLNVPVATCKEAARGEKQQPSSYMVAEQIGDHRKPGEQYPRIPSILHRIRSNEFHNISIGKCNSPALLPNRGIREHYSDPAKFKDLYTLP